jgi:hypothetical protein
MPGDADVARLRAEAGAQHLLATQHQHETRERTEAAHRAHLKAVDRMADASDLDIRLIVDRLRREALPQARTNLAYLCLGAAPRRLVRGYLDAGEFGRVRAFYRKTQLHNAEVKAVFQSLANEDLKMVVEDVCRADA